jgi:Lrp/AsnC family transcriptional regulator, leucine-responsive regulatory protein
MSDLDQLDLADRRILREIQHDGRMPVVELAERVSLSKSPCLKRLRRLEKEGYILRYIAELDAKKMAQGYLVYVQVKLANTTRLKLEEFNKSVQSVPQIQSCHMVSGGYDYLLKIRTRDMTEYRTLLGDVVSCLPGVAQTSTYPVMEEVKDTLMLAIDDESL